MANTNTNETYEGSISGSTIKVVIGGGPGAGSNGDGQNGAQAFSIFIEYYY